MVKLRRALVSFEESKVKVSDLHTKEVKSGQGFFGKKKKRFKPFRKLNLQGM